MKWIARRGSCRCGGLQPKSSVLIPLQGDPRAQARAQVDLMRDMVSGRQVEKVMERSGKRDMPAVRAQTNPLGPPHRFAFEDMPSAPAKDVGWNCREPGKHQEGIVKGFAKQPAKRITPKPLEHWSGR
ncbi:hypothetical protein [Pseudogemmobacter sonorensis]|uniref:hypothetical protein n=1 Tax=Pseudogemmobacter sonorensis TaxID=2989681 RepID=UPI00367B71E8